MLKYGDVSGIESDFKPAPVGVYHAKVESIEQVASKSSGDQQFQVTFQITKDANGKKVKQNYGRLWYYAPVDPEASWARRLKELITAFGLKPKGGNLATIEGKECLVRLREDTDLNGDYRPTIGKLMKVQEAQPEADEDEDEDEAANGLSDLTRAQLKALIKENELDITVKKSMSDDELRELVQEEMGDDEEDDEPEDEEEPDDEDEDEEDDDEEDEEPEAEEDNYDSMSPKALRQELKDRELETKGAKAVLIARLRTDDVEEPV